MTQAFLNAPLCQKYEMKRCAEECASYLSGKACPPLIVMAVLAMTQSALTTALVRSGVAR